MKKRLSIFLLLISANTHFSNAQIADGSTAPDFTVTDMNGTTHNLYTYLNAGKTVFIDFFTTWCGPCWNYHESGAFYDLNMNHGPTGTISQDAVVLAIEVDGTTPDEDMTDWLTYPHPATYPFSNPPTQVADDLSDDYDILYIPAVYKICPDKKTTYVGTASYAELAASISECNTAGFTMEENNVFSVSPNPAKDYVVIQGEGISETQVSVFNSLGQEIAVSSSRLSSDRIQLNTAEMSNGIYTVQVRTTNGVNNQKIVIQK